MKNPQVCYVLLNTSKRGHARVAEVLNESPDIVVKVSSDDIEQFAGTFSRSLKRIPGVKQVKTLIPTAF